MVSATEWWAQPQPFYRLSVHSIGITLEQIWKGEMASKWMLSSVWSQSYANGERRAKAEIAALSRVSSLASVSGHSTDAPTHPDSVLSGWSAISINLDINIWFDAFPNERSTRRPFRCVGTVLYKQSSWGQVVQLYLTDILLDAIYSSPKFRYICPTPFHCLRPLTTAMTVCSNLFITESHWSLNQWSQMTASAHFQLPSLP